MILLINACVREESRTKRLADCLIFKLNDTVREVRLSEIDFPKADADYLRQRDEYLAKGDDSAPMFDLAKEFAAADTIVVAAPFWDLSFPAALKQYFEQINVPGITFCYSEEGSPRGLCKAKKLYYVTTAGGTIYSEQYGYGYVSELAHTFYGIEETVLIKAEGLDVVGADVESILQEVERAIDVQIRLDHCQ